MTQTYGKFWRALSTYFRSGWAFFIPYLAAYLLYAWLKWPVNFSAAEETTGKTIFEINSLASARLSLIPCLLHLYWGLHAIHLILAVLTLRHWWKNSTSIRGVSPLVISLDTRSLSTEAALRLLPWLCIALIFWISGPYLEFPADPWAHYSRINEWEARTYITAHSAGQKASYFFAYSLFGILKNVPLELAALDVFHAAVCLLVTWQYYRLARATELQITPSLIFAILGTVTLGNNIFGFYRYYGISSSAFAQIGFLAGTRCLLVFSKQWIACPSREKAPSTIVSTLASMGLACAMAAMNHLQALGLIALSTGAISMWAVVAKFGKVGLIMITTLMVLASLGSMRILNHDAENIWLNDWGSFALLSGEAATYRAMEILGLVGLVNLISAILLTCRNHVVGWLTLFPVLALSTPIFAFPLSHGLQAISSIEMFNRMLLAIPVPMSLVCLADWWLRHSRIKPAYPIIILGLAFLTTAPPSYPNFNRLFNSLERSNIGIGWQTYPAGVREILASLPRDQPIFGPPNALFISDSFGLTALLHTSRDFAASRQVAETAKNVAYVHDFNPAAGLLLVSPTAATEPTSYAGYLSRHWSPQVLAFESAGYAELRRLAEAQRGSPIGEGDVQLFLFGLR